MISLKKFLEYSQDYDLVPIYEEIIFDTETPVSLYKRLGLEKDYSFLLESVQEGRHSFIGFDPEKVIKKTKKEIIVTDDLGNVLQVEAEKNLNQFVQQYLEDIRVLEIEELPPFSGGLVGYFSYEMIGEWEDIYHNQNQEIKSSNQPLSLLVLSKLVIAYDHMHNTIKIINNVFIKKNLCQEEKIKLYQQSKEKIVEILALIKNRDKKHTQEEKPEEFFFKPVSNTSKEEFKTMVKKAKEYIKAGEVFQLVLSQKFAAKTSLSPFQVFRALRVINPSPYLFYLNFPELKLIGSSPEVLVKVENDRVITRPLAGTRPRGENKRKDQELKKDLLNDQKERAEHIMLVDLGRNDLGRVCQTGSVEVTELMGVEYYSQVMHLVSQVEGIKKEELSSLDVLESVFPAGTVSGAPKIRAIELIDQLEKEARGAYAGAVGYIDFRGNLDTCITIRTFTYLNDTLYVQVGAGIVADSIPEKEYEETLNKAKALFKALNMVRKDDIYGLSH